MVQANEMAAGGKCGCVFIPRIAGETGRKKCPACGFTGIHHNIDGRILG
jgi:hypothetical protein